MMERFEQREKVDYKKSAVSQKPEKKLLTLSAKTSFSLNRLTKSADHSDKVNAGVAEVAAVVIGKAQEMGVNVSFTQQVQEQVQSAVGEQWQM